MYDLALIDNACQHQSNNYHQNQYQFKSFENIVFPIDRLSAKNRRNLCSRPKQSKFLELSVNGTHNHS